MHASNVVLFCPVPRGLTSCYKQLISPVSFMISLLSSGVSGCGSGVRVKVPGRTRIEELRGGAVQGADLCSRSPLAPFYFSSQPQPRRA